MTDIRKILKVIDEAQVQNQPAAEAWVVDEMKRILADPEDDGSYIYSVYDILHDAAYEKQDEFGSTIFNLVKPTTAKALFTKAVGLSPAKFSDNFHKEQNKKSMAGLDARSKKIWRILGDKMTTTLSARDAKYIAWYKISPKKIAVLFPDNKGLPAAVIGDPTLTSLKMGMEDMIKWLSSAGIKQMKRPKVYKSAPSYYD